MVQITDKRFTSKASAASFTPSYNQFLSAPRLRVGSPHLAYLKISEGCSNFCKFCSIPYIRGVQVSRTIDSIVDETKQLIESGAKEIGLIAQDTTSYGRDIYGAFRVPDLLKALSGLTSPESVWYRLMYAFPRFLTEEMLDILANDPRFCPYIDMPLQHISDKMLSDMGRGMMKKETIALLDLIQKKMPKGAIRTTFIVGYPGETDEHFEELLNFVKEGRFSHAGVFMYSKEPKTPSAYLDDNVPLAVKKQRRDALMKVQLDVSRKRLKQFVGKEIEMMYDGPIQTNPTLPKGVVASGRSRLEAPEVDGVVFLKGKNDLRAEPGDVFRVKINQALDYDLVGEING